MTDSNEKAKGWLALAALAGFGAWSLVGTRSQRLLRRAVVARTNHLLAGAPSLAGIDDLGGNLGDLGDLGAAQDLTPETILSRSGERVERTDLRGHRTEQWKVDGKLHRIEGPAKIVHLPDGTVEETYWLNGFQVTPEEHRRLVALVRYNPRDEAEERWTDEPTRAEFYRRARLLKKRQRENPTASRAALLRWIRKVKEEVYGDYRESPLYRRIRPIVDAAIEPLHLRMQEVAARLDPTFSPSELPPGFDPFAEEAAFPPATPAPAAVPGIPSQEEINRALQEGSTILTQQTPEQQRRMTQSSEPHILITQAMQRITSWHTTEIVGIDELESFGRKLAEIDMDEFYRIGETDTGMEESNVIAWLYEINPSNEATRAVLRGWRTRLYESGWADIEQDGIWVPPREQARSEPLETGDRIVADGPDYDRWNYRDRVPRMTRGTVTDRDDEIPRLIYVHFDNGQDARGDDDPHGNHHFRRLTAEEAATDSRFREGDRLQDDFGHPGTVVRMSEEEPMRGTIFWHNRHEVTGEQDLRRFRPNPNALIFHFDPLFVGDRVEIYRANGEEDEGTVIRLTSETGSWDYARPVVVRRDENGEEYILKRWELKKIQPEGAQTTQINPNIRRGQFVRLHNCRRIEGDSVTGAGIIAREIDNDGDIRITYISDSTQGYDNPDVSYFNVTNTNVDCMNIVPGVPILDMPLGTRVIITSSIRKLGRDVHAGEIGTIVREIDDDFEVYIRFDNAAIGALFVPAWIVQYAEETPSIRPEIRRTPASDVIGYTPEVIGTLLEQASIPIRREFAVDCAARAMAHLPREERDERSMNALAAVRRLLNGEITVDELRQAELAADEAANYARRERRSRAALWSAAEAATALPEERSSFAANAADQARMELGTEEIRWQIDHLRELIARDSAAAAPTPRTRRGTRDDRNRPLAVGTWVKAQTNCQSPGGFTAAWRGDIGVVTAARGSRVVVTGEEFLSDVKFYRHNRFSEPDGIVYGVKNTCLVEYVPKPGDFSTKEQREAGEYIDSFNVEDKVWMVRSQNRGRIRIGERGTVTGVAGSEAGLLLVVYFGPIMGTVNFYQGTISAVEHLPTEPLPPTAGAAPGRRRTRR